MKVSQFCLKLKVYYSCSFLYHDADAEIYSFMPAERQTVYIRDVLYVTASPERLPTWEGGINLLLCSDREEALSEVRTKCPAANVIRIEKQSGDDLAPLFVIISEIFLQENRFASQINHLSHISSSSRGMQALIDEASRMLDAPIIVIDTSYRLMVMSTGNIEGDDAQLEEQRNIGTLTEQNLMRMRRDRIFEYIRKKPDRMLYCIAPDSAHWWMNMLVYVHGIEVAEIGIMENSRKFTEYDIELMKHLRYLLSMEIQRGQAFGANFGVAHGLLVSDLLEQKFTTIDVIRHRTKLLGWQSAPLHRVMTVYPKIHQNDVPKHFRRKCEILASQITRVLGTAYWRAGENDLVFIIPLNKVVPDISVTNRLSDLLKSNQMMAIISNPFASLLDVRKGYDQTAALYKLREYFVGESPVYRYEDQYILHIAAILHETHDLRSFYHPYVLMLKDYDAKNHTEFVKTLYEYLTYIDNPNLIAKHLHIHKNTLYYRINKLKELFPVDLNDGKTRLHIQLTLELMRLDREYVE